MGEHDCLAFLKTSQNSTRLCCISLTKLGVQVHSESVWALHAEPTLSTIYTGARDGSVRHPPAYSLIRVAFCGL